MTACDNFTEVRHQIHDFMRSCLDDPSISADVLVSSVIGKLACLCFSHDVVSHSDCSMVIRWSWFYNLLPYCQGYLSADVPEEVLNKYFSLLSVTPNSVNI